MHARGLAPAVLGQPAADESSRPQAAGFAARNLAESEISGPMPGIYGVTVIIEGNGAAIMSSKLKKLPRRAAALMLAVLLAFAPIPASATSNHWSSWTGPNHGCEWLGHHSYDEIGAGHARGATYGRGDCSEVMVKVWYDDTHVRGFGQVVANASVYGWGLDFKYTDHNADPEGPPPYVGFRLW